ncbi:MAG: hypothetical protein J7453_04690 [Thermomicrobium sp.]|nr:hypothetical protein [Thermomicrobium sp.]
MERLCGSCRLVLHLRLRGARSARAAGTNTGNVH